MRDALFIKAAEQGQLNDESYKITRLILNGFLRWAEGVTGCRLAALWLARKAVASQVQVLELRSPMADDINETLAKFMSVHTLFLAFSSISGLLLVSFLVIRKKLNRFKDRSFELFKRVGSDEFVASKPFGWLERERLTTV